MTPEPADSAPAANGPTRLQIVPQGWQLSVARGKTLLQAALHAGVRMPSSCRNGTCRACKCRLLSGAVRYTVDWPGLLAEEKAEGWVLPCVALPLGPVVLEQPMAVRPHAPDTA